MLQRQGRIYPESHRWVKGAAGYIATIVGWEPKWVCGKAKNKSAVAAKNTGGLYGPAIVLYNTAVMDPCYTYILFCMFVLYLHSFYVFV